jgi:hypothetical protein
MRRILLGTIATLSFAAAAQAQYPIFLGTGPYYVPQASYGVSPWAFEQYNYVAPSTGNGGRSMLAAMRGNCGAGNCPGGVCQGGGGFFSVQELQRAQRDAYQAEMKARREAFVARWPQFVPRPPVKARNTATPETTSRSESPPE